MRRLRFFELIALAVALLAIDCSAPESAGCLSGGSTCVPPSACRPLSYVCAPGKRTRAHRLSSPSERPPGPRALGAVGDWVLENELLIAVIDDIDHPHHLAPTGGTLLDLAPKGGADQLNQAYQVVGILPRDAAHYRSLEFLEGDDGSASIVARGRLDGDSRVEIVTRYELRPCDPGLRIRTEVYNGGRNVWSHYLSDAFFWGDRGATAFVPIVGDGFRHPELDLVEIDSSWRAFPWMAAQTHGAPDTSYAVVSCTRSELEGVNDVTISAAGLPRTIVRPGDGVAFERMIFAAKGPGLSGAQSLAVVAHGVLFHEDYARVFGRVVDAADRTRPLGGDERLASLLIYEPGEGGSDDPGAITPWAEAVPAADGTFDVFLPAGKTYGILPHRLGRALTPSASFVASGTMHLDDLPVPGPPRLEVHVRDAKSGEPIDAEVILVPAEGTDPKSVEGSVHGAFSVCAPFLGPPHGPSPACNRALALGGEVALAVTPGTYWVYATAGLSTSLARTRVTIGDGSTASADLRLTPLTGILPPGSLQGDFHVHGGRSFDSGSIPDRDRVLAFLTAGVQVIAATDHDVCASYGEAIAALGVSARVKVIPGVESTALIPYLYPPGVDGPNVIGHFNFWPLPFDPARPRNGAPWDELQEPGALYDVMRPLIGASGVAQLNHPLARAKIHRDEGYLRMLGYKPIVPLPDHDDGTALGMLYKRPGGQARNIDWDTQEVMNGGDVLLNLQYRTQWYAFLNQGILRAGTANSDSHSLNAEMLGYPRNVVLGSFSLGAFDVDGFDAAVKNGAIVGTSGPVIEAVVRDTEAHGPSITALHPGASAKLEITVRAAPWIPVEEVRIVVNGRVAKTIGGADIKRPGDPFGADGIERYKGSFALSELLSADGWIVVEAGLSLPQTADDDHDGLPDRFGVEGDGQTGKAAKIELPAPNESDARFHANVVFKSGFAYAFTNPFVIDLQGDGWRPPGP